MDKEKITIERIELLLSELGREYRENQIGEILPEDKFVKNLTEQLNQNETYYNSTYSENRKFLGPVSNFWEQFFFGNNMQRYYSLSALLLLCISIGFSFYDNFPGFFLEDSRNSEQKILDSKSFGSRHINQDEKWEKQMIKKIQDEHNIDKKKQYIEELIEYYKETRQFEKLNEFLNAID